MENRDYYDMLGIERGATPAECRRAYWGLAQKYHPDRNPGSKKAEENFKEVNEAYSVLSDPEKRQQYDQFFDDQLGRADPSGNSEAAATANAEPASHSFMEIVILWWSEKATGALAMLGVVILWWAVCSDRPHGSKKEAPAVKLALDTVTAKEAPAVKLALDTVTATLAFKDPALKGYLQDRVLHMESESFENWLTQPGVWPAQVLYRHVRSRMEYEEWTACVAEQLQRDIAPSSQGIEYIMKYIVERQHQQYTRKLDCLDHDIKAEVFACLELVDSALIQQAETWLSACNDRVQLP